MSRESMVAILGLVVFFTPFLGIPSQWKEYIFIGSGVLLMLIGYSLRRAAYFRRTDAGNGERKSELFSESRSASRREEFDSVTSDGEVRV